VREHQSTDRVPTSCLTVNWKTSHRTIQPSSPTSRAPICLATIATTVSVCNSFPRVRTCHQLLARNDSPRPVEPIVSSSSLHRWLPGPDGTRQSSDICLWHLVLNDIRDRCLRTAIFGWDVGRSRSLFSSLGSSEASGKSMGHNSVQNTHDQQAIRAGHVRDQPTFQATLHCKVIVQVVSLTH